MSTLKNKTWPDDYYPGAWRPEVFPPVHWVAKKMYSWAAYLPSPDSCVCQQNEEDYLHPCYVHNPWAREERAVKRILKEMIRGE